MQRTKIEWADSTWNPVTGCKHGCEYCYARRIAERFSGCEPVPEDDDRIRAVMNGTETGAVIELSAPLTREMEDGKVKAAPYPFGFSPRSAQVPAEPAARLGEAANHFRLQYG